MEATRQLELWQKAVGGGPGPIYKMQGTQDPQDHNIVLTLPRPPRYPPSDSTREVLRCRATRSWIY
jgi:hypothetical protein